MANQQKINYTNIMKTRYQIRFIGRVQGVGFRYTSYNLATSLGLTGWVLNDWDDSVLMEVQGDSEVIDKMIERLDSDVFIEIERMEKMKLELVKNEGSFEIKY